MSHGMPAFITANKTSNIKNKHLQSLQSTIHSQTRNLDNMLLQSRTSLISQATRQRQVVAAVTCSSVRRVRHGQRAAGNRDVPEWIMSAWLVVWGLTVH